MKLKNIFIACLTLLVPYTVVNSYNNTLGQADNSYSVYVENSMGGVLTADKDTASAGDIITLSYEAEENFFLDKISVNGEEIEGLSFTMPEEDVYVYGSFVKDISEYSITVINNRYGVVSCVENARPGQEIKIIYTPQYNYVLSHFLLNDENIGKVDSFKMPRGHTTLEGVFVKAIEDTNVSVTSKVGSGSATSYWYFSYEETALRVTTKVVDRTPVTSTDVKHRDYVELLVTPNSSSKWVKNETFKFTATRDGSSFVRVAVAETALSDEKYDEETVSTYGNIISTKEKYISNKEGYTGYEVVFEIPYVAMGFDSKESAIGNFRVAPAMYNAQSEIQGTWAYYGEWFVVSTLLLIDENGVASV